MKIVLAMLIAALCSAGVSAREKPVVAADTKETFETAAAGVRKERGADGRYSYAKPDERVKVEAALTEMGRLFDEHGSVEHMSKDTQVKLLNQQETVNSILTLRDRDRLVCERGALTGTHMKATTCRTYGEIEAIRVAGRKSMDDMIPAQCSSNCPVK